MLTRIGISAVVNGLGWFSLSKAWEYDVLLGRLGVDCAVAKGWHFHDAPFPEPDFLEPRVVEVIVLDVLEKLLVEFWLMCHHTRAKHMLLHMHWVLLMELTYSN